MRSFLSATIYLQMHDLLIIDVIYDQYEGSQVWFHQTIINL